MELAPIVLFVYNRPWHTRQTLEALSDNYLADQSELIVFADGPKHGATDEELNKIIEVRSIIKEKLWCKSVQLFESEVNKGLAKSIVNGVNKTIDKYGKVIVIEDDILTSRGFLKYMNDALIMYQNEEKVMQISGYMYPIPICGNDTFLLKILSCWGWATWKRAWDCFEWDVKSHIEWVNSDYTIEAFDIYGHAGFYQQLLQNKRNQIESWAVRWYASWLKRGGYNLYPKKSLTKNIGHDGTGINCVIDNFYDTELIDEIVVKKIPLRENIRIRKKIDHYYNTSKKSMIWSIKERFRKFLHSIVVKIVPELKIINSNQNALENILDYFNENTFAANTKIDSPARIYETKIDEYSYVSINSRISNTVIGKFCSIGPNFLCGWGIHPVDGLSTSPVFYSKNAYNGISFTNENKVVERKPINIGNDVFIGTNVTVLDGVNIGDGAIIAAGSIVAKDIPAYAVAGGVPAKILKYRFEDSEIEKLLSIKWWEWPEDKLPIVANHFYDINQFIKTYS